MSYRYADPNLLRLGSPPELAKREIESLRADALANLIARFNAAGVAYDTGQIAAEPAYWYVSSAVTRDVQRRQEIDDAVAQTYLGSSTAAHLDQRAADYGVLRRIVQFEDTSSGTAQILEDDDSLRFRARMAWEALSVAGPSGAYVFHALDAHPHIFDAIALGPETGFVAPGEVLVVLQGRGENTVPTPAMVDAVAARLDAWAVVYGDGTTTMRPVRDRQSVRPLGARVTVAAARAATYSVTATLYVSPYADREAIRLAALANLAAYTDSRKRIWRRVPKSGLEAALALVRPDGVPIVDDVDVVEDDIVISHREVPVPGEINVTVVAR